LLVWNSWVEAERIVRFEANGNRILVLLSDHGEIYSLVGLKHYSDMLHLLGFYLVDDKHLVNREFVEHFNPHTRILTLRCKTQLQATLKRVADFLSFMNGK